MLPPELLKRLEAAQKRGNLDGQDSVLRQMLSLTQEGQAKRVQIMVLCQLGRVRHEQGALQEAYAFHVRAAELAQEPGVESPPELQMVLDGDLGESLMALGDWPRAKACTRRALEIAASLPDPRAESIYRTRLDLMERTDTGP